MKNPFLFLFRARDKPTDTISAAPTFYFGSSTAGKSVTVKTAIQMSTVYACVRVIAETIASLPLHVYQADGQGSKKALEHPLYRILHPLDEQNKWGRLAEGNILRVPVPAASTPLTRMTTPMKHKTLLPNLPKCRNARA